VVDALTGPTASAATKESFRKKLRTGELDDKEIEVEVAGLRRGMPLFEIPGMRGRRWARSRSATFSASSAGRTKTRRLVVKESYEVLINEESISLLDRTVVQEAVQREQVRLFPLRGRRRNTHCRHRVNS